MYYIRFIHSLINENLVCFHVLAIVNTATLNIGVHISFLIRVFLRICPGVELLATWQLYFKFSEETSYCFS